MIDRHNQHKSGGRPTNPGGASLVAMISPVSPQANNSRHMGTSLMSQNMIIGKDINSHQMDPKKNSAAATYARGKKDLQGIGLMMKDQNGNLRKKHVEMHDSTNSNELRDSRIGMHQHGLNQVQGRDKNYVSHSPQPYNKFKLGPSKNNLMVYGQSNNQQQPGADVFNKNAPGAHGVSSPNQQQEGESRSINGGQILMTGRNANGYPITSFENSMNNATQQKNIERYQKGSFVGPHNQRRGKAHSNNAHGQSLKINQSGIMIGLPKVSQNKGDPIGRGSNDFSPTTGGQHNTGSGLKMPALADRQMVRSNDISSSPGLPSLQRHQQQRFQGAENELKQVYQNSLGHNKGLGSNNNDASSNALEGRRRNPHKHAQRDKDSRSHSNIGASKNYHDRSANALPSYSEMASRAQHQGQIGANSLDRKPANEPSSPASVSIPYNNSSYAHSGSKVTQSKDNIYSNIQKDRNSKAQRGTSSRNQANHQLTTDLPSTQDSRQPQAQSNSPPMRGSLNKLTQLSNLQAGTNFQGLNIRRQPPTQSVKNPKKEKVGQITGESLLQPPQGQPTSSEIITHLGVATRTGFIPQMRKVNQDSYCIQKDLAGVPGLWMFGVMDGHGVNGHQASNFCKLAIPTILGHLMQGATPGDIGFNNNRIVNRKQKKAKQNDNSFGNSGFLPNITGKAPQRANSNDTATDGKVNKTADEYLSTDTKTRDRQIQDSFELCQDKLDNDSKIDVMFSGTTSVYCFLSNNHLVCANAGDSRGMLCSFVNNRWQVTQLSRDHKPEEPDEAARVKRTNGRIEQSRLQPGMSMPGLRTQAGMFYGPKRVWLKNKQVPGLAMTRSIGDMAATSVGVTAKPEMTYFPNLSVNDKILVMGSDGLWDRFSNHEIMMTIVNGFYQQKDPDGAVNYLMKESVERWTREQGMVDDITIVVAFLNVGQNSTNSQANPETSHSRQ